MSQISLALGVAGIAQMHHKHYIKMFTVTHIYSYAVYSYAC